MGRIWANRLEAGTQQWSRVPLVRRPEVKMILQNDVDMGRISSEMYFDITGEKYPVEVIPEEEPVESVTK